MRECRSIAHIRETEKLEDFFLTLDDLHCPWSESIRILVRRVVLSPSRSGWVSSEAKRQRTTREIAYLFSHSPFIQAPTLFLRSMTHELHQERVAAIAKEHVRVGSVGSQTNIDSAIVTVIW